MKLLRRTPPVGLATAVALGFVSIMALSQGEAPPATATDTDPSTLTAETMPLASESLVLDIAQGASRAIAVGERGHVLVSESRSDWRQVEGVPTRSTLTAVAAVGEQAWAVGHDGVILHSGDGGLSWTRQREAPYDRDSDEPTNGAPLLDVLFLNETDGFAIGGYSLLLRTRDGGKTWDQSTITEGAVDAPGAAEAPAADEAADGEESWTFDESQLDLDAESDPHLNAIARTGDGSLIVMAERGSAFRSVDGGETWQRLQLPYAGSMFGVIGFEGRHVLAFGMRGRAFESNDLGDSWTLIDTGTELSLLGGTGWGEGGVALVGANGVVLTRSEGGSNLLKHEHPDRAVLSSAIALAPNGALVVVGEKGVGGWSPN